MVDRSLWASLLLCAAGVVLAAPALGAAPPCSQEVAEWARRCAEQHGIELAPAHCPPGRLVLRLGGPAAVDVEIGPARPESFRRVGELGLSPVGEFADWSAEPAARRRAFDELSACVRSDPPLVVDAPAPRREAPPEIQGRRPLPWLAIGGVVLALVACVGRWRQALPGALVWLAGGVGAFVLRWMLLPRAFFHQNGQGALWISYALSSTPEHSPYGPGYAELFGWAARAGGSDPERSVFLLQAAVAALVPPLAWIIARRVGAPRPVAAGIALVVLCDPVLARLAQSESYFSVSTALIFGAAAVLAQGSVRGRIRALPFAAAVASAGLLVAQAARVHPLGWIGAALLPLVVSVGPGPLSRRLRATLVAGAVIAAIVAVASGPAMLAVVRGSLGQAWLPRAGPRAVVLLQGASPMLLLAIAVLGVWTRKRRGLLLALLLALALAAMWLTNLLGHPSQAVHEAYDRLFWPALVAIAAAWLARLAHTRARALAIGSGVGLAGLALAALRWTSLTALPTDAEEARFALEWRDGLPADAVVAYVERAGERISVVPLYDGVTGPRAFPIRAGEGRLPDLAVLGGPLYYYRSSLCSSEKGRSACDALERSVKLETVAERELPARPSMRWHPYSADRVRVVLSRRP